MTTNQRVRTLTEPECLKRLERSVIGRVAWNTVDGPQMLPVTYRVHHRAIVFVRPCTVRWRSWLARARRPSRWTNTT